jgi:hypothetical protein
MIFTSRSHRMRTEIVDACNALIRDARPAITAGAEGVRPPVYSPLLIPTSSSARPASA